MGTKIDVDIKNKTIRDKQGNIMIGDSVLCQNNTNFERKEKITFGDEKITENELIIRVLGGAMQTSTNNEQTKFENFDIGDLVSPMQRICDKARTPQK